MSRVPVSFPGGTEDLDECALSPPSAPRGTCDDREAHASPAAALYCDVMVSPPASASKEAAAPAGGRGRHTRTASMAKRRSWQSTIEDHMRSIPTLLTTSFCSPIKCTGCDTASWATLNTAQSCAVDSFGVGVLDVKWDSPYDWKAVRGSLLRNQQATHNWFDKLLQLKHIETDGAISIAFHIHGRPVCQHTWQVFHGVPDATMDSIVRLICKGQLHWNVSLAKEAAQAHRAEHSCLVSSAVQWWCLRLDYYECIVASKPKCSGVIQHPHNVDWKLVYDEEFVPEMNLMGHNWRKSDGSEGTVGSRSSWYEGRTKALQQLAVDKLGPDAPPFVFQSRAKHSAYVSASQ